MSDADVFLPKDKLPAPPGIALDYRYVTRHNDWWVKTAEGWFWMDLRSLEWKRSEMGPP